MSSLIFSNKPRRSFTCEICRIRIEEPAFEVFANVGADEDCDLLPEVEEQNEKEAADLYDAEVKNHIHCVSCRKRISHSRSSRGCCDTCRPHCEKEECDGVLVSLTFDAAICDECKSIHILENGKWTLEKNS